MANRFCSLHQSSNAGFGPLATNPNTCMTISCPNPTTTPMDEYFEQSQWGSNINNSCMKPLADAQVSKQYRCDERWYDWFTVPNYHLGNGYANPDPANPGICYNPCAAGSVPVYQTDPIDGQTLHFVTNEDDTGNCISRANYFTGKYAEGSDYCPLSWIYILNSTPSTLKDQVNTRNTIFANSDMASNVLTKSFADNQINSTAYANTIFNTLPTELNNILIPTSSMQNACNKIETKSRVLNAYDMCVKLKENETKVYDAFSQTLPEEFAKNKVTMMKQACNAVFCNQRDTATSIGNVEPLCFKNVGTFNPSTGKVIDPDSIPPPAAPVPIPQKSYMYSTIKTAIYLVLFPILIYIIYIFFTDALYPYVLYPGYLYIRGIFSEEKREEYKGFMTFRDLYTDVKKYTKLCENSQRDFNAENAELAKQGLPQKPKPIFTKCQKRDDAVKALKSALDNYNQGTDRIVVPNAPSGGTSSSSKSTAQKASSQSNSGSSGASDHDAQSTESH